MANSTAKSAPGRSRGQDCPRSGSGADTSSLRSRRELPGAPGQTQESSIVSGTPLGEPPEEFVWNLRLLFQPQDRANTFFTSAAKRRAERL